MLEYRVNEAETCEISLGEWLGQAPKQHTASQTGGSPDCHRPDSKRVGKWVSVQPPSSEKDSQKQAGTASTAFTAGYAMEMGEVFSNVLSLEDPFTLTFVNLYLY